MVGSDPSQGEVAGVWTWAREEQVPYPQAPKPPGRLAYPL